MELTPRVLITETPTFNWNASMFITTKPPEESMSPELFLSILSPEPWTQFGPARTDRSSDRTILSLDSPVPETIGLRDTTQKVRKIINSLQLEH